MTRPPAPVPEMVKAARTHLTGRFARGLDRVLWEEDQRPLSDAAAIAEVLAAAQRGEELLGPDLAAALVVMQAHQLDVDRLEYDLVTLAHTHGLTFEQIAAVLDLADTDEVRAHLRYLTERAQHPVAPVVMPILGGAGAHTERPAKAGKRTEQTGRRARQVTRRQRELAGGVRPMSTPEDLDNAERRYEGPTEPWYEDNAESRNDTTNDLAEEANRQGVLAFLRAAEAHDKAAAALDNAAALANVQAPDHAADLQRQADMHRTRARHHRAQAEQDA